MRRSHRMLEAAAAVALALGSGAAARGEDGASARARELFRLHQDAVVWVTAVMKVQMVGGPEMGHPEEQKVEALGTVIDRSGLTVLSYAMLDPTSLASLMGGGEGVNRVEFKNEFSDVKIRLGDGTELPARVVLKDLDLDLAFVLPDRSPAAEAALAKQPLVKLEKAPELKVLDEVLVMSRLGQSLDRQPTLIILPVSGLVKKPRTFITVDQLASLGTPVFLPDGTPVGIAVMRKGPLGPAGLGMMLSAAMGGGLSPVVLPAEGVMEVARQALPKPAKAEEAKAP